MDDLYREQIIERYKSPQYRGHLDPHDIYFEDDNPLCGDHIEITIRVDESDRVAEAAFDGKGCAISQASADLLIESIHGKPLAEVKEMNKDDVLDMLGIDGSFSDQVETGRLIEIGNAFLDLLAIPLKIGPGNEGFNQNGIRPA